MNALVIAVVVSVGVLLLTVFIDRVLIPFRARRTVEKLLKSKTQHDPRTLENPKYGTVAGGVECLRITSGKGDASELRWSEVEEVHAYKRDLFTTDLICLAFKKSGREEYYQIHEEMAGYHDLLEILQSRSSLWSGFSTLPSRRSRPSIRLFGGDRRTRRCRQQPPGRAVDRL